MKQYLAILLLTSSAFAQLTETGDIISANGAKNPLNLTEQIQKDEANVGKKSAKKADAAAVKKNQPQDNEIMVINPQDRAADFKQAYEFLRQQKAASRITFTLKNGEMISNIIDLNLMKGGSLVIFQVSTTQGYKYMVVKVEDIESIGHQ